MATIGSFTQQADGSYSGSIKTLTLNVKAAQGWVQGRTPASSWATIWLVMRA